MESRAKLFGHPVHQMLVTFPIGAFGLSVVSDALHAVSGEQRYAGAAQLALDVGLITAGAAIPFGLVDWLSIPRGTSARRTGVWHAAGNAAMLGLFGASRWLRSRERASARAKALSGAAFMLSGVAAWLGGELVDRHGIGVKGMPAPAALPWDTSGAPQPNRAAGVRTPVTPG
jgi:uncharacterized membrane protein